ncbi:MAG TPA: thermonuclease family protein [Gallionella sp.]|nr:thermonuclease family protein [Gallionella sp.]
MMSGLRCLACALLLFIGGIAEAADFCELPPCDGIPARTFSGKVIAVLDGDTLLVLRNNRPVKVRLAEIDAPEKMQTFGETSRRSLSDMVLGKQVKVSGQAVDKYGRMVAHLGLNGLDVNAEQIRRGMAWEYSHFHGNQVLVALQEEAKQVPRGLWALSNPTPPWEWRKLHPNTIGDQPHAVNLSNATPPGAGCGSKKYCSEMASCEEARHYLTQCGIKTLDGNGDGVPCEKLCVPRESKAD